MSIAPTPLNLVVVTLFPDLFPGPLGLGILQDAHAKGLWNLHLIGLRDFARDAYGAVDDAAFGGGAGMVMRPDIVGPALEAALRVAGPGARRIFLSPRGVPLTQSHIGTWAAERRPLVLLCGRYEGVDQRIMAYFEMDEVSLGDFILMGGEVAAMALMEATLRLVPGVLGNAQSLTEESFGGEGLLEYPHYTRPRVWEGLAVPDVLMSGHHREIAAWRHQESQKITQDRRPDLWEVWTQKKECAMTKTRDKKSVEGGQP